MIALLVLIGIFGGMIAGMVGVGGGVFYVLVLPIVFAYAGLPANEATPFVIANSLVGIAVASLVSVLSHMDMLKLYWKESVVLGLSAVLSSVSVTYFFVHSPYFSPFIFRLVLVGVMLFILLKMWFFTAKNIQVEDKQIAAKKIAASGLLSGIISAVTGLGGGVIVIPILQIIFKQSVQKAKMLSLSMIFLSALAMSIQNILSQPPIAVSVMHWGYVLPFVMLPLAAGTVIGARLGVRLSKGFSDKVLRFIFMAFVLVVLIDKLWRLMAQ